jgi:hypothetical protein
VARVNFILLASLKITAGRNEVIRNELGISPLSEKIVKYRNKWKAHLQRMEHTTTDYTTLHSTTDK